MPELPRGRNRRTDAKKLLLFPNGIGGKERMDPMKKLIALLLCICLALGMVPAVAEDAAETEAAPQITSKTFPVYHNSVGNVWREGFPVYFLNICLSSTWKTGKTS